MDVDSVDASKETWIGRMDDEKQKSRDRVACKTPTVRGAIFSKFDVLGARAKLRGAARSEVMS